MPERARAVVYVLDSEGRPIPTATITLRQSGTTTNITETIYANDDPDTSQLTNGAFFSGADGKVVFYLTDQKRLDMLVTKSGYTSQTIPIDVQKSTLVAGYATVQDEGTGLTQRATLNFTGAGVTATDDAANGRTNVAVKSIATDPIFDAAGDLVYGTGADAASRLGIGTAGQVLQVNAGATAPEWAAAGGTFVGARATRGTSQSIADATDVALAFTSEAFDTSAFHDNATNPSRFTIPTGKAGKYRVVAFVRWASNATGIRRLYLRKNNTTNYVTASTAAVTGTYMTQQVTDIIDLAVSDYVEAFVVHTAGVALDAESGEFGTHMSLEYLGA